MDDFASPRISNDDSRETDENENDQNFRKNQKLKKPQMKHFMSPTISATSKATVPRNKILTERNEFSDSSETHHQQRTPDLITKNSRTFYRKSAGEARVYESDKDEHNDSSSKPYDPLTNYLSPRPKFLRYKPNRHREIYNKQETKVLEGSDSWSSSKSSDGIENEEADNFSKDDDHAFKDDEEEEFEDIKNEGGSNWIGLFKFILVSVVLLLLTWYISCMNSSEPIPTIYLGKNGYIGGYNSTLSTVEVCNIGKQKKRNEFSDNVNEMDRYDQTWKSGITESSEKPISFQNDQVPSASDLVSDYVLKNGDEYKRPEAGLEGTVSDEGIEIAESGDNFESSDLVDMDLSEKEERGNLVSLDSDMEIANIDGISAEGDGKVEVNDMGSDNNTNDSNYGAFIGLLIIIASLLIGFYLKCKRNHIEKSRSVDKPLYNATPTENISSENQILSGCDETHVEKVNPYATTSMYFQSIEENAKYFPSARAPTVELLGEFVVGEGRSITKSCYSKRETEMKPKEIESQGDTNYVFLDNVVANSRDILSTPEFSASTTMDSPMYGSVTDKKKATRKEEGSMTTTPVRRSSRIRNRALSP